MAAPQGNKNGIKLKEPDYRQEAYRQYCEHLAAGYSKKSWCYKNSNDISKSLTYQTMEKYMDENKVEFDPILMDMAISTGMKWYEDEGRKIMQGKYRNSSPEIWKTCMRNKYEWDKEMIDKAIKCSADIILGEMRSKSSEKSDHYKKTNK